MEELRLVFLVIGACAIAGILIHGLWSVRKNASKKEPASLETSDWQDKYGVEEIVLDDLGPVTVVNNEDEDKDEDEDEDNIDSEETTDAVIETDSSPKIYSSVVTQPKPEYAAEQVEAMRSRSAGQDKDQAGEIPEPPPFLLKTGDIETSETTVPTMNSGEKATIVARVKSSVKSNKTNSQTKKRIEPKLKQTDARVDQMRIDFDEPSSSLSEEKGPVAQDEDGQVAQEQEVLVLNVTAPQDNPIGGAALLPMLLTLGFKFGDQDIFHRHVNSNGKGPVLFSLANMFKPGVFDIDNLANFSTQGVSLFMVLPIEGDPHQVFNMMHNAARKISEEFSAVVLDGRRNPLTKQGLQQYVEKIREFERQRLIQR